MKCYFKSTTGNLAKCQRGKTGLKKKGWGRGGGGLKSASTLTPLSRSLSVSRVNAGRISQSFLHPQRRCHSLFLSQSPSAKINSSRSGLTSRARLGTGARSPAKKHRVLLTESAGILERNTFSEMTPVRIVLQTTKTTTTSPSEHTRRT